ncbi:hypothetical protein [Actinomadura sp. 6N118]|uniref:hypothetical protein n=1 Tax=Actinomadura sp. 6N118 TaxID=3375151 RepID=UPI0037B70EC1
MSIPFTREKAPCGKIVDARHHREMDDQGLVIDDVYYSCGCRRTRHEYHDGSARRTVVRHDGKLLADDLDAFE